jgi:hypothetical protein
MDPTNILVVTGIFIVTASIFYLLSNTTSRMVGGRPQEQDFKYSPELIELDRKRESPSKKEKAEPNFKYSPQLIDLDDTSDDGEAGQSKRRGQSQKRQDPGLPLVTTTPYQRYWELLQGELQSSLQRQEVSGQVERLLQILSEKRIDYGKILDGYREIQRATSDEQLMGETVKLADLLYRDIMTFKSTQIIEKTVNSQLDSIIELMAELQQRVTIILKQVDQRFRAEIERQHNRAMRPEMKHLH